MNLLYTRSEEMRVLGVGSIPVPIVPSCQDMETIALQLHKREYSWVVKIGNTQEVVLRPRYSLGQSGADTGFRKGAGDVQVMLSTKMRHWGGGGADPQDPPPAWIRPWAIILTAAHSADLSLHIRYVRSCGASSIKPIFHRKLGSRWVPNANEIYTKKRNIHGQRQHFALGPNATYIPLTGVGVWRWV